MADTLESIFLNTSLGPTELDDGEHTLVTTNANTSFVIKDMHVNGTSALTNTHLELNGFNVSGITSNATGSLIIPPNSTLKIKTTDYPYSFREQFDWVSNNSEGMFRVKYTDSAGNATGTETVYHSSNISSPSNVTDVYYLGTANDGNPYAFYTVSDGNSSQQIKYWRVDNDTGHSNIRNDSYKPFGLWDNKAWYMESTNLKFTDLYANPSGSSRQTITRSGSYTSGYSPYTTSSYPRARCSFGWFWYQPSSGYDGYIYGIRLEGSRKGNLHQFNTGSNNFGGAGNFAVSIDEVNDKMYIWSHNSTSSITVATFNNYSTKRDTDSNALIMHSRDERRSITPTQQDTGPTYYGLFHSSQALGSQGISQTRRGNMSQGVFGYLIGGGFTFKGDGTYSERLVEMNPDLSVKSIHQAGASDPATYTFGSQTMSGPNRGVWRKTRNLSTTESSALGLSAPTFGIQLLGVKSTV